MNTKMLNVKPIFIVGFQRGGTNILLNLLRSHPNVCSPRGETQEVFKGKRSTETREPFFVIASKILKYIPILLAQKNDLFTMKILSDHLEPSIKTMNRIDKILYYDKLKALGPTQNLFKEKNVKYTLDEIGNSRILLKNLNGLIFLTDMFYTMYPDATFIAIVRDGFSLAEGHIRRGADPAKAALLYEEGCKKIISDEKRIENYHILKFEDLIGDPVESLKKVYKLADLDINMLGKIRLETTKTITNNGEHEFIHNTDNKELLWYSLEEFANHYNKDVNKNQRERLTKEQEEIILENAQSTLQHFSYI